LLRNRALLENIEGGEDPWPRRHRLPKVAMHGAKERARSLSSAQTIENSSHPGPLAEGTRKKAAGKDRSIDAGGVYILFKVGTYVSEGLKLCGPIGERIR